MVDRAAALRQAEAAPALAGLVAERHALEAQMAGLTGQGGATDPRYQVEPLDRRRAALAEWADARDALRGQRRDTRPAAQTDAMPAAPEGRADLLPPSLRTTAGERLRPTPGEMLPDARPRRESAPELVEERPLADPPVRGLASDADLAERPRRRRGPEPEPAWRQSKPRAEPRPAPARPREQAPMPPLLDQRLARAREKAAMAARAQKALAGADRSLDAARDAIPADWRARAQARIPGLGRADPYVRETAEKLRVAVGTIEELGEKADRMRSLARDMRELKAADEANDEARRERALERLKARRQED
jgi:hypothetical protein